MNIFKGFNINILSFAYNVDNLSYKHTASPGSVSYSFHSFCAFFIACSANRVGHSLKRMAQKRVACKYGYIFAKSFMVCKPSPSEVVIVYCR